MAARFGQVARHTRIEKEIQLKKIAEELDYSSAYISDIEQGNRNPPAEHKVRQWAHLLGVDPDYFVELASLTRPIVEVSTNGDPRKAQAAYALNRGWGEWTDEQQEKLLEYLKTLK